MGCGSSTDVPVPAGKDAKVVPGSSPGKDAKVKRTHTQEKKKVEAVAGRPSVVAHSKHEQETAAIKIQHAVRQHHKKKHSSAAAGASPGASPGAPAKQSSPAQSGAGEQKLDRSQTAASPRSGAPSGGAQSAGASPGSAIKRTTTEPGPEDKSAPVRTSTIGNLKDHKFTLTASELKGLWKEYDKDGNGFLTKKELAALAMAINNQVLEAYRSAQRKAHPNYSAKKIESLVQAERAYLLPSGKDGDTSSEMARRLVNKLDINHDGKVSEREFYMQFNAFTQEAFEAIDRAPDGSLGCSIM